MATNNITMCVYVGHTMCLLPLAVAVYQHLVCISLPDYIWVIIIYMGRDRELLTCSIQGKYLLLEKKGEDKMIENSAGGSVGSMKAGIEEPTTTTITDDLIETTKLGGKTKIEESTEEEAKKEGRCKDLKETS